MKKSPINPNAPHKKHFIWQLVQCLGVIALCSGVAVECVSRADIGYVIISVGSLFFSLGTKFMYYKRKYKPWMH